MSAPAHKGGGDVRNQCCAASSIDVRDCPECENGTKGNYEGRVLIGGRGTFTCPVCGTRWQDANEKPSSKGIPINLRRTGDA